MIVTQQLGTSLDQPHETQGIILLFFSVKMTENETEEIEAEAEAPPAAAEEDPDKVKPVVFIGLFITALLALGMIDKSSTNSIF